MEVIRVIILCGSIISAMGYKTTNVASVYYEPIFVMVDTERAHIETISANAHLGVEGVFSVGGDFSLQQVWNQFIEVGFAKIHPLAFAPFSPSGNPVYITIWCQSQGFLWHNVPQHQDISFIVNIDGEVVKSKYGNIWQDESGRNMKLTAQDVARAKASVDAAAAAEAAEEAAVAAAAAARAAANSASAAAASAEAAKAAAAAAAAAAEAAKASAAAAEATNESGRSGAGSFNYGINHCTRFLLLSLISLLYI